MNKSNKKLSTSKFTVYMFNDITGKIVPCDERGKKIDGTRFCFFNKFEDVSKALRQAMNEKERIINLSK